MNTTNDDKLLMMSLASSVNDLSPSYLLNWLDSLPGDWQINCLEDIIRAILGYVSIFHNDVSADDAEFGEAAEYWQESVEDGIGCRVDDGDVVIVDEYGQNEICRLPLPEWVLRLEGVIEFLRLGRDRVLTAGELKDVLEHMWSYMFLYEGEINAG